MSTQSAIYDNKDTIMADEDEKVMTQETDFCGSKSSISKYLPSIDEERETPSLSSESPDNSSNNSSIDIVSPTAQPPPIQTSSIQTPQNDPVILPFNSPFPFIVAIPQYPLSPYQVSPYQVSPYQASLIQQQQWLQQQILQQQLLQQPPMISSYPASITNQINHYPFINPQIQQQQQQQYIYDNINNNNNNNNNTFIQPKTFTQNHDENKMDTQFNPKFNNHAKGNFYISKEMISRMINESNEEFITKDNGIPDEKLAFGHYKESVAMQINDDQIKVIESKQGLMIIINIDLHFKSNNNDIMYLIAKENDKQFRDRVRWCIKHFMSAAQIKMNYGLEEHDLPKSSRNMAWFKRGIQRVPKGLSERQISKIVANTRFKSLPAKTSKRRQTGNQKINKNKLKISERDLKFYVEKSLYNDNFPIHPVVVIKGKNQWIEWKRYIELFDDNNNKQYVGISMKYYDSNKQWKIECMDYDAGRVFYQHRLASLSKNDEFSYSYNQLSRFITTTLDIYHSHRWH